MARYGIEVAQDEVKDAQPKDKTFSSEYQSPKVHASYLASVTLDGSGNASIAISHDLLYAPAVMAYYEGVDGRWRPTDNIVTMAGTDRLQVKLFFKGLTPGATLRYKFWIFSDPAQEF